MVWFAVRSCDMRSHDRPKANSCWHLFQDLSPKGRINNLNARRKCASEETKWMKVKNSRKKRNKRISNTPGGRHSTLQSNLLKHPLYSYQLSTSVYTRIGFEILISCCEPFPYFPLSLCLFATSASLPLSLSLLICLSTYLPVVFSLLWTFTTLRELGNEYLLVYMSASWPIRKLTRRRDQNADYTEMLLKRLTSDLSTKKALDCESEIESRALIWRFAIRVSSDIIRAFCDSTRRSGAYTVTKWKFCMSV